MKNLMLTLPKALQSLLLSLLCLLFISYNAYAQTIMFDDFTYSGVNDAALPVFNKWNIVNGTNGPPSGAQYRRENVNFINDPANPNNRLMTLSTTVNGATKATTHSRIETAGYEYFEGTYAARVNFSETPFNFGDGNVQTFYTIVSHLLGNDGSRYSELDFEYLASDKWGITPNRQVMYMTSWNRYIPEPWQAWKRYFADQKSWAGWHTCVVSCTNGRDVKYWIDGYYFGSMATTDNDGSSVYPRSPMHVAFANWIWNNVVGSSTTDRTTTMQVDWTLFYKDQEILPAQVDNLVATYRSQGLQRRNLNGQTFYTTPVNQAPSVALTAPANNNTYTAPASITITANASDADGTISRVEFFNGNTKLGERTAAPYSYTWTGVGAGTYNITARATDNAGAVTSSAARTVIVNAPIIRGPYGGTRWNIPGIIEAENYDTGGQGVAFNDLTTANEGGAYRNDAVDIEAISGGGYNVGWIQANEWLEYSVNVSTAGNYTLQARVAAITAGRTFRISMDGTPIADVTVPNTGGWQTWQTVSIPNVTLTAGQKIMRIFATGAEFNLDRVQFTATVTNQAPSVSLTAPANNASYTAPATITITASAADADGSVTRVEFFSGTTKLGESSTTPYSYSWNNVAAGTYSITARATDNAGAVTTSSARTITVTTPTPTQSPYGGTAWAIPGTIEAENYDLGGQGIAFNELSTTNQGGAYRTDPVDIEPVTGGGYNVGWIQTDEWLEYTVNVASSGTYSIDARVATTATGKTFRLELDGTTIANFSLPNTTGWQTWQTVTINNVNLTAGQKILRMLATSTDFNLDRIVFRSGSVANQAPTVSLTNPANNASYTAPASVTISATAADADGSIARVEFFSGNTKLGERTTTPYSYTWNNVAAGTYSITARATDNSGATTTSAARSITVTNPTTNACSNLPQYVENGAYVAGSRVRHNNNRYECKPWPFYYWCSGSAWAYEPGNGFYWQDAWILLGSCTAGRTAGENETAVVNDALLSNAPNPFSGSTSVELILKEAGEVNLSVYNKAGQLLQVLSQGYLNSGNHTFFFEASGLQADLYIVKCSTPNGVITRKMVKTE